MQVEKLISLQKKAFVGIFSYFDYERNNKLN